MKKVKRILQNNLFKSILLVTGGTGIAQLLNILLSPVITRIFSPDEYGILTVYVAILGSLTIVGSLKYDSAIPIAEDDEKAINILVLCLVVLFTFVGIVALVITFSGHYLLSLFNAELLFNYRYLVPIGILFVGLYDIFSKWAFRKRDYYSLSKTKLNQSLFSNGTKVGAGLLNFGPVGLVLGHIIGTSAGIFTLAKPLFKQKKLLKRIEWNQIKWGAKRYKKFPLYSAPSQFLNAAGIQLPILFITSLYGAQAVGFYGLASSMVNLPMNLIGNSVGDVFYGEASKIGRKNPLKIKELSMKIIKQLIIIGLIPLITLIIFGPTLFTLAFGTIWSEAGVYAQIISLLVFFRFIFMPISRVFEVFEKQKEALFLDITRITLVISVFLLAILTTINVYWTLGLYSIVMSFIYFITFIVSQRIINNQIKKIDHISKKE